MAADGNQLIRGQEVAFPVKLQPLFAPKRYKVAYGGRGAGRSWGFARALLLIGAGKVPGCHFQPPVRILCAREMQNSIADSVHKVLSDQIYHMGLDSFYNIEKAYIRGVGTGTEFSFEGIKHNVGKIKSYEGVQICWVEEAARVSKSSWSVLIPTIRTPGSEIWITFNPELETDETYQRFVKNPPPPEMIWLCMMTYKDNPWFPDVLREEMEELKRRDYDAYLNVWEGHCLQMLEGAVYAKELRSATEEGRIRKVPYERLCPVDIFCDLGRADATALWFAQKVGMEYRALEYYENKQLGWSHYMKYIQNSQYQIGNVWLPHDAKAKQLGSERTIEEQTRAHGFTTRLVPKLSIVDGINAGRTLFPNIWFDEDKCEDGINALRHYRYEVLANSQTLSQNPLHDWASHGADAFRYMAIALKEPRKPSKLSVGNFVRSINPLSGPTWLGG